MPRQGKAAGSSSEAAVDGDEAGADTEMCGHSCLLSLCQFLVHSVNHNLGLTSHVHLNLCSTVSSKHHEDPVTSMEICCCSLLPRHLLICRMGVRWACD